MKLKTAELTGNVLDWVVAICDDRRVRFNIDKNIEVRAQTKEGNELPDHWDLWMPWNPSTNWEQGGSIIEREGINILQCSSETDRSCSYWVATLEPRHWEWHYTTYNEYEAILLYKSDTYVGPTPLIAALRCYVANILGDEIELPEELK